MSDAIFHLPPVARYLIYISYLVTDLIGISWLVNWAVLCAHYLVTLDRFCMVTCISTLHQCAWSLLQIPHILLQAFLAHYREQLHALDVKGQEMDETYRKLLVMNNTAVLVCNRLRICTSWCLTAVPPACTHAHTQHQVKFGEPPNTDSEDFFSAIAQFIGHFKKVTLELFPPKPPPLRCAVCYCIHVRGSLFIITHLCQPGVNDNACGWYLVCAMEGMWSIVDAR